MTRVLDRRSIALSAAVGAIVVLISMAMDFAIDVLHPHGFWIFLLDDVLMGVIIAAVVLLYEQRRRRELAAKLSVIAELNHRIRNQLEVIQYSAYTTKEKEHIAMIAESVSKIEAALSEILERRKKNDRPRTRSAGANE